MYYTIVTEYRTYLHNIRVALHATLTLSIASVEYHQNPTSIKHQCKWVHNIIQFWFPIIDNPCCNKPFAVIVRPCEASLNDILYCTLCNRTRVTKRNKAGFTSIPGIKTKSIYGVRYWKLLQEPIINDRS